MDTYIIKRGAPLSLRIDAQNSAGETVPIPLDWTAESKLTKGSEAGRVAKTFAPVVEEGSVLINDTLDDIPCATYFMDVKLLDADQNPIDVSETVCIKLVPSPTTPPE